MNEQTKAPASALIDKAETLARSFLHNYLGVEHVFITAVKEGLLTNSLQSFGISESAAVETVRDHLSHGEKQPDKTPLTRTPRLKRVLDRAINSAFSKNDSDFSSAAVIESLFQETTGIVALSLESLGTTPAKLREALGKPVQPVSQQKEKKKKTPLLDQLGRDLTEIASQDKLDPVIGRTDELRRVMQILTRKTKNVPVLIGEPGVGKTAIVLALAQRMVKGNVPQALRGKLLIELPLASLIAGTSHRGELEERVQKLISEISQNEDCIIFIDEIHGIVGAGGNQGPMDIANMFKPALADGSLRVIGATTTEEYQKYLSKDQALERRLQPVLVKEPSEEETIRILQGLKESYEQYHGVVFQPSVIEFAVKLAIRYLPDRRLPDKALDLLDEAASRVKTKTGVGLTPEVGEEDVAAVTSLWSGIPVEKLTSDEKNRLLDLESLLKKKVVGQDEAIQKLSQAIRISRAGLGNAKRPVGVFLFLGPTGVGKTELAKAVAELIYGSPEEMIRLDMSEFKEPHTAAKLIGAPPGYIGHDEEGQLTKAVHTKPYSLILLDEIEKAHPEIFDLFLQIFDDARLTDSKGRTVSFRNALIIMTSNVGSAQISKDIEIKEDQAKLQEHVNQKLKEQFRPEFLNRIDEIIIFNPLSKDDLKAIVDLQLQELKNKLKEQKIDFEITPEAAKILIQHGYDPAFGARPLRRAIQQLLAKPLAETLLKDKIAIGSHVLADASEGNIIFKFGEKDAG